MDNRLNDPKWLTEQYRTRSAEDIAKELGVCRNTVLNRLIAFDIPRRKPWEHRIGKTDSPEVRAKYAAARRAYWRDHPEQRQAMSERLSKTHLDVYGYKRVNIARKGKKEHRLIMEAALGRQLSPDEVVHHINGCKTDNRLDNLMVMSFGEHATLHGLGQDHTRHRRFAKLSRDDILTIRRLWEQGTDSQHGMARRYGVSVTTIWRIAHNKRWANI